jgi:hypothetical protein
MSRPKRHSGALRAKGGERRGAAIVAMVAGLLLISLMITGVVVLGAGEAELAPRRIESVQAFYAAESGLALAAHELMTGEDTDGDGVVGSISDDEDDASDLAIGRAAVRVESEAEEARTTVTSVATVGPTGRRIQMVLGPPDEEEEGE